MIFAPLSDIARGNTRIAQYLLMMYLIHKWGFLLFFFLQWLIWLQQEKVLCFWGTQRDFPWQWKAAGRCTLVTWKKTFQPPLMEAGQGGENITRETWSKWKVLPSLPTVVQQTLCFIRWKIICSSSKHHRAADVEASPTGRKTVVTLEYILDASVWAGAAVLQTALHHWGLSGCPQGSALLRHFSLLAAWLHEGLLGSFGGRQISHFFQNSNSQHGIFRPPSLKGQLADRKLTL